MSNYTITLHSVVESIVQSKTGKTKYEFENHDDMIDIASEVIFDKYPIYNESHRQELNNKIINHYYFRELCATPYQRWRHYINTQMKIIMPYYNDLYKMLDEKYDLFNNLDYTETLDRDLSGTQDHDNNRLVNESEDNKDIRVRDLKDTLASTLSSESDLKSDNNRVFQDTPTSRLGNEDYATDVTDTKASELEKAKQNESKEQSSKMTDTNTLNKSNEISSNSKNKSVTSNTEDYVKVVKGKNSARTHSEILMEARRALINIDEMIIKKLNENFSGYFN